ncbi:MAG: phosphoenolpyruvate-utilizing protein [Chloroflexota bacterium]|nr:phosphoenolpyruvate-utilizing protein [Chloroflexota bacterium]
MSISVHSQVTSDGIVPGFEFDEARDLAQSPYWFLDATHSVPPWTPMFGWFWTNFCRHGMQYGAETLSLPTCRGWDWRFKDGGGYLTVYTITDPAEIRAREERFRQTFRPFVESYDQQWNGFKSEMLGHYARLKSVDPDKASNFELLALLEDTIDVTRRMWEVHMYMMYGVYTIYLLFEDLCKELLGIDDTSPDFHRLLRGYDNKVFEVDRALWRLARAADEAGLASAIARGDAQQVIPALEASEAGRQWLKDFRTLLDEDGWRLQRMAEINLPSWVEDPTPALQIVRKFIESGADFDLDRKREQLARERHEAQQAVLVRVRPADRDWFSTLMSVAERTGAFSEEHNHYLDLYTHAMIRRTVLGIGRRLVKAGTIDQAEDTLFLIPEELRRVLGAPGFHRLQGLVAERREAWQSWQRTENPPLLGTLSLEEAVGQLVISKDPIALKVVVGAMPKVDPDVKADLYGVCGSPGVAEGTARVILDESRLGEVQPGDILVAATTSPSWTSVFAFIKGVVVDRGASLSHAAVVGREYGIPVVMNVFEGTKKIHSGQRIRVDGTGGHVFILPQA